MRHFLKFLAPDKRAEAERQYQTPKSASASAAPAPAKPLKPSKPSAKAPSVAKPKKPVGPEFGGLIERRSRSREAPQAPQAPQAPKDPAPSRPAASKTQATEKSWDTRFDIDSNEIKAKLEEAARSSTGVFLASLDNSAITLADSGLYKLDEEGEKEIEKDEVRDSFNPYNQGWSNR